MLLHVVSKFGPDCLWIVEMFVQGKLVERALEMSVFGESVTILHCASIDSEWLLFIIVWAACEHGICDNGFCGLWVVVVWKNIICIYIYVGSMAIHQAACKLCHTNLQAALLLVVWLCWWFSDWNGVWVVWTDLLAADW